ncbi:inosine monophosphate dehydrogenase [Lophiostoma macrostomum CBS 122681]|uniref:Inosine monophosphate dehydrogenase n=1 Tax=Lophiostoma macrostomum CBS 122681 TaxID=1314788 RepID=A0A6A6TB46_9PLEO|nr:inosine monophosphate dehydrogenase [Lophiostoma macrostomum CBS 122681]
MADSNLQTYLPWTQKPLIVNAPMAGYAGGALASSVTLSGGLGLIGGLFSMEDLRSELSIAASALASASKTDIPAIGTLPVGVGLLTFVLKIADALPVIRDFKPAVIWLFAAKELDDYKDWASEIRRVSPESKIWIQCGNVGAALHIAKVAAPDALCMQGADAGGHGYEKSAGIISLLPEAVDTLAAEGFAHIPLLASGGIVDGRGVAAALALGAKSVVMGTRFLASEEVVVHPAYQAAVLEARDGGQATKRSKLFDELKGPNVWPEAYDGRSLVVKSYKDYASGVGIEEIRRLHNEEVLGEDKGFKSGFQGRATIWCGTGVGLVGKVQSARDIVESVREETREILSELSKL